MKRLGILGLIVVIVLGTGIPGARAAGLVSDIKQMLGLSNDPPPPPPPPTPLERLGPPPFLLSMKPLEIPVIANGAVQRRLSFRLRLSLAEADNATLSERGHLLHAAFFQDLMVYAPNYLETHPELNLMAIKARMKAVADRVLGPGVVKEVLIQGFFER
ncbi:hypothetical protein [Pararhodospirillum oryzae]|uniref:Flagellar protein FliL n=1 Tax=Pararhodospirillum oryzae TaxID=478448 RepID=A0A512HAL6_9PROT|nr:hypothetical protein [Pararhodospirillum oryzae]GEO82478.1 hypothetical protein ROR02_26090 [Pararhodospirillum oryzae]